MSFFNACWPWALLIVCAFVLGGQFESIHAQDLLISEFMAAGGSELEDEDGDTPDWIEILSVNSIAVELDGWYLTDDALDPFKWRFPNRLLLPGDAIVVFASGKHRIEGQELHSNFRLSSEPGYLALIAPDGTIVHEYNRYPLQRSGRSYGLTQAVVESLLVADTDDVAYKIPADDSDTLEWTEPDFVDSAWLSGPGPIGFDTDASPDLPPIEQINLALDGTATQSSTGFGGEASRAIDGNTDGSYSSNTITHTTDAANSWWEVDLGDSFALARIVIWNRQDCCAERLSNFRISVLNDARQVVSFSDHFTDQGVPPTRDYEVDLAAGTRGRFVRLSRIGPDRSGNNYISLSEFEVFGGEAGFGPVIETDVESSLAGINSSLYLRATFEMDDSDIAGVDFLSLRVKYDDGFALYLNGEIAAARNSAGVLSWSSNAEREHPDDLAVVPEEFNLSNFVDLLRIGQNVIAVQALNLAPDDDDFLIGTELVARTVAIDVVRYFPEPSPGSSNPAGGLLGFVEDTQFSANRGFYDAAFDVEIWTDTPGATIRYTTDSSVPTATRGDVYRGPIRVASTTVLRAAAFKTGLEATNVDTQSYIFLDDVISSNVMDSAITESPAYAPQMRDALSDLPTVSIVTASAVGGNAEVPGSIEWIQPDGSSDFQEDAGVRNFGGAFTNFAKKNFRLYFRKKYGAGKLKFPLFKGHERNIPAVEIFDQLELRSGSHDMNQRGFYMSNRFTDDTMLDMGNVNPHGRFVHLYRNGTYWGQYHLRERWNADMLSQYLRNLNGESGEKDDYEAINGNWNVGGWADPGTPYDGDGSAWTRIKSLRDDYEAVSPYLDVAHYIDFMLMHMFGNAESEYRCVGPKGPGSGFKFFLNDADGFTRSVGNRTVMDQPGRRSGDGPGSIFSTLLAEGHPEYKILLADRIHSIFFDDGAMTPARNRARLLERCDQVERAFIAESARWGYRSPSSWVNAKNAYLNNVLQSRTSTVINQYRSAGLYPSLDAPTFSRREGAVSAGTLLTMQADAGKVYYTADGSDPRLPGGSLSAAAIEFADFGDAGARTTLLISGATVRAFVPGDASLDGSPRPAWTLPNFDDSGWMSGTTGVGYETGSGYQNLIDLDVETQMFEVNTSIYLRLEFDIDDVALIDTLTLRMKYDDGYVTYLNGERVAAGNAPAAIAWNSAATGSHSDSEAVVFQDIDISASIGFAQNGRNVLSIHGLNRGLDSSDMLILPEVVAREAPEDPPDGEGDDLVIDRTSRIRARSLSGANWSAMNDAIFVVDSSALRITELMYNPPSALQGSAWGNDQFEFIELQNVGDAAIALTGIRFVEGVQFEFQEGFDPADDLAPGETILVVSNFEAFSSRYDTTALRIAGEYRGQLDNDGERVVLADSLGATLLDFVFADTWYPATDGVGFSLEIVDAQAPAETWNLAQSWIAGSILGSPGVHDIGIPPDGGLRRQGDFNGDATLDISDPLAILIHLFVAPRDLPCEGTLADEGNLRMADVNGDGQVDVTDSIHLLGYLFRGGSAPVDGPGCVRMVGCSHRCRN